MKDVEIVPDKTLRITIPGELHGWALKITEDLPQEVGKKGWWLSQWFELPERERTEVSFRFGQELTMVFNVEEFAKNAAKELAEHEIPTKIVKV